MRQLKALNPMGSGWVFSSWGKSGMCNRALWFCSVSFSF
jgi:hypothetical protein